MLMTDGHKLIKQGPGEKEEVPGPAKRFLAEQHLHLVGGHLDVVRVRAGGSGHDPRGGDQSTCHELSQCHEHHERMLTDLLATDLRTRFSRSC